VSSSGVASVSAISRRAILWTIAAVAAGLVLIVAEVIWTAPTRGAVRTYNALLAAANDSDPEKGPAEARRYCTARYLATHALKPAQAGGLVGLPRNIHKNFQVWRRGSEVWLCPTNRVGPVYRFVREAGDWKFDGPVGLLGPGGRMVPFDEEPDSPEVRRD
jgi:hypothetical protein